jgi:hypothetical protein
MVRPATAGPATAGPATAGPATAGPATAGPATAVETRAAHPPVTVEEWFGHPTTFVCAIQGMFIGHNGCSEWTIHGRMTAIAPAVFAPAPAAPAPRDDGAARPVARLRRHTGAVGGSAADWEHVAPLAGCLFAEDGSPNPPDTVRAMSDAAAEAVGRPALIAAARHIYATSQTPRALASATVATAIAMGRQFFSDAIATPELFEFAAKSAPDPFFFAELFEFD